MSAFVYIRDHVLPAALGMLPAHLDSPSARAMLLAIGLQESRFENRRQVGGPARGFWQFELGGGVRGVRGYIFRNPDSAEFARSILGRIGYSDASAEARYAAIEHNDILACLFARCLLWTLPQPLPQRHDVDGAWAQYLDAWRPGKPHRATWDKFYKRAWAEL